MVAKMEAKLAAKKHESCSRERFLLFINSHFAPSAAFIAQLHSLIVSSPVLISAPFKDAFASRLLLLNHPTVLNLPLLCLSTFQLPLHQQAHTYNVARRPAGHLGPQLDRRLWSGSSRLLDGREVSKNHYHSHSPSTAILISWLTSFSSPIAHSGRYPRLL